MPNDSPRKPNSQNPSNPQSSPPRKLDGTMRFPGVSKPPPRPSGTQQNVPGTPRTERSVTPKGYREMAAREAARRQNGQKVSQETAVFKTEPSAGNNKKDLDKTQPLRAVSVPRKSAPESGKIKNEAKYETENETKEAGSIFHSRRKLANTGCLRGALYFVVVVVVSLYLAVYAWNCVNDVLALIKSEGVATITVTEGYTIPELTQQLYEKGIIEKKWLFSFYCNYSEAEETIETGTYEIRKDLDYRSIVRTMRQKKERTVVSVLLREGLNVNETIDELVKAGVSNREALLEAVAEMEFNYSFLEELPMGSGRLEGYLYPDKYEFYSDESPRNILNKLVRNFDRKLRPSMRKYIDEKSDYDLNQILTIASMIQLEAANVAEMRNISSVIHNRLKSKELKRLQIDATLVYIIGRENKITAADIVRAQSIDSPYNTYMYEGLPPGPICSPSIDAISAALYPSKTSYYYYALTDEGVHEFNQTLAGHNQTKRNNPETYPDESR